jgi:ribosome biogenesis GTPase / thiamine phosphate phosphatase
VAIPEREVLCRLRGKMKDSLYEETDDGQLVRRYADPVAVGDEVRITVLGEEGVLEEILPRRTKLSRLLPKPHDGTPDIEQIIVANIDQVVIVASVEQPRLNLRFIDRLMVLAEFGGVKPILCINKADLLRGAERAKLSELLTRVYKPLGATWHMMSATEGENIDALRDVLAGQFSVFAGSSGVGKSSILNALHPEFDIRTREVSKSSQKGRHTTTYVRIHHLDDIDARIADTPGIREVGLWGVPTDTIDYYFLEMRPFLGKCKYSDCWHFDEPRCAIRGAVDAHEISRERYESYRRLCQEGPVEDHERRVKRLR